MLRSFISHWPASFRYSTAKLTLFVSSHLTNSSCDMAVLGKLNVRRSSNRSASTPILLLIDLSSKLITGVSVQPDGPAAAAGALGLVHVRSASAGVLILDLRLVVQAPRISSPLVRTVRSPKRVLPSLQSPL